MDLKPEFAPVCGVQMYEDMLHMNVLPDYVLLLAHDVVSRANRYWAVFAEQSYVANPDRVVIMDNSITELGNAVDLDTCLTAAKTVHANVPVLPDVYEDSVGTIKAVQSAYKSWTEAYNTVLGRDNYSFMVVPQGKTLREFAQCAEALSSPEFEEVGWWGIPRNLVNLLGSRATAISICNMLNSRRRIHLLGFSDNILDDIACARGWNHQAKIAGIDSAVPLRCASHNITFNLGLGEMPKRHPDWLVTERLTPKVALDWQRAQSYINGD